MRRFLRRINEVYSHHGATEVISKGTSFFYREVIRNIMPGVGHVTRNGISTGEVVKLGDKYLPSSFVPRPPSIPGYEDALSEGLRRYVQHGDKVLVIGGGTGVTSTIAAIEAGSQGHVLVYEGSTEMTSLIRKTHAINDVEDNTQVLHGVVGDKISLRGSNSEEDFPIVDPKNLPECQVLELDCEGAEVSILKNMTIKPRSILVESHGMYGATSTQIVNILEAIGYEIKKTQVAETRIRNVCLEKDIKVIFAIRK